ncbi:MAG TPA: serine protease [Polyangiaceae bacterium]|nr:serine protease [Polyangiaceae bacterium]
MSKRVRSLLRFVLAGGLAAASAAACADVGPDEGQAPDGGAQADEVVYGTDDRQDVFAHPNAALVARARQSTVALMSPSGFNATNPNNVTFNGQTLQASQNLCSNQRFLSDPTPAFCSGTLIDDDLVLTAGHCITSQSACNGTRFVFNFFRPSAGTLQTVTTQDIFSCASLVVRQQGTVNGQNLDYAIVRLDRAATPRFVPAPVREGNSAMAAGQNVAVIGSGSGIPFKIDSGGSVRDPRAGVLDFFVASTDTFGGNSGSGVYETANNTVAGILVRGETDYVSNGSCNVVNVCSETGCRGEDITYVRPAINAYCATATSARLCSSQPPPPPPPPPPPGENSFSYSGSNTNSAQQNTTNRVVALKAGDKITVATCGLSGSAFTGDTFLRLAGPTGAQVASNDDACGGRGSSLTHTAAAAGNFEIRAGCFGSTSCTGTVVFQITAGAPPAGGSFAFNESNTNSAQQSTTNQTVALTAGQTIQFGTCTVPGASGTGDTFLRLFNPSGVQVASNDDSCGSLSFASHTAAVSGNFQIRAGCFNNTSCTGTVAYTVQ